MHETRKVGVLEIHLPDIFHELVHVVNLEKLTVAFPLDVLRDVD